MLRSCTSQRHLKKIRRARPIFLSPDKSDLKRLWHPIFIRLNSSILNSNHFSPHISYYNFIRKCHNSKLEMAASSPFLGNVNTSDPICSLYHQRSLRFWPSLYYGSARQSIFSTSSLVNTRSCVESTFSYLASPRVEICHDRRDQRSC